MLNPALVTVGIPVYNGAQYLAQAIESALAQTHPNTEVFVVNDGSTDEGATEAVAQKYAKYIKYLKQENKGVGGAMNNILRHMTGDFFSWLSHDDVWLPHKLESQLSFYKKIGVKNAILFSNYFQIDEHGSVIRERCCPLNDYCKSPMLPLMNAEINGCTLLIPAAIIKKYGPFNENLRFVQDYDLWNRILKEHDFFLQPESLVKYRIHPGQGTRNPDMVAEADDLWMRVIEDRTLTERVQLYGSSKAFFVHMAERLERSRYKKASAYAWARSRSVAEQTLVSVVLYAARQPHLIACALESILRQTHPLIEVVLVGTREVLDQLKSISARDSRIHQILQEKQDKTAARQAGLQAARGEYIAYLGSDSEFLPRKIELQLAAMLEEGSLISHTSLGIASQAGKISLVKAGEISGVLVARAIAELPTLHSTIMIHRSLVDAGIELEPPRDVSQLAWWTQLAANRGIRGIKRSLTITRSNSEDHSSEKPIRVINELRGAVGAEVASALPSPTARVGGADRKKQKAQGRNYRKEVITLANEQFENGSPETGISLLRSAIAGSAAQAITIADSLVKAGRSRDAVRYYRQYLALRPGDGRRWYSLGSCLAVDRCFCEADKIFRRNIEMPLQNGMNTNTSIIRFSSTDSCKVSSDSSLLQRRTVNICKNGGDTISDVDVMFFVSCDSEYLLKFLRPLLCSLEKNAGVRCGVHLHIINPTEKAQLEVDRLQNEMALPIVVSREYFDTNGLPPLSVKAYFSLARFLLFPDVLSLYSKKVMMLDIDQIVMREVGDLISNLEGNDIGIIYFSSHTNNIMSLISASTLMVQPNKSALKYLNNIRDYLINRINDLEPCVPWHLDQVALAVSLLQSPFLRWYPIPTKLLQSSSPSSDSGTALEEECMFWSVTASIPENAAKLREPFFAEFGRM
jgi:glycosyltransferase involved in cell wall biosynthesis